MGKYVPQLCKESPTDAWGAQTTRKTPQKKATPENPISRPPLICPPPPLVVRFSDSQGGANEWVVQAQGDRALPCSSAVRLCNINGDYHRCGMTSTSSQLTHTLFRPSPAAPALPIAYSYALSRLCIPCPKAISSLITGLRLPLACNG